MHPIILILLVSVGLVTAIGLLCFVPCVLPGVQHKWGEWQPDGAFIDARYCKNCTRRQRAESDWWSGVQAPATQQISLQALQVRQRELLGRDSLRDDSW